MTIIKNQKSKTAKERLSTSEKHRALNTARHVERHPLHNRQKNRKKQEIKQKYIQESLYTIWRACILSGTYTETTT